MIVCSRKRNVPMKLVEPSMVRWQTSSPIEMRWLGEIAGGSIQTLNDKRVCRVAAGIGNWRRATPIGSAIATRMPRDGETKCAVEGSITEVDWLTSWNAPLSYGSWSKSRQSSAPAGHAALDPASASEPTSAPVSTPASVVLASAPASASTLVKPPVSVNNEHDALAP